MKAILYVGAALMVAASIYGFIDYKKSSHDKNFNRLYNSKEVRASKANDELNSAKEPVKVVDAKQEVIATPAETTGKEVKANSTDEKKALTKKKRKVTVEKFSRAKLDDLPLVEEIKAEPKKEARKVERKQQ